MGIYDQRARELMRSIFGQDWVEGDESVSSFGDGGGYGEVDGTIAGRVAVEFGVGGPKQIRAAVLELALHPYEAKTLVLVDTPSHSTHGSIGQAGRILQSLGRSGVVIRISNASDRERQVQERIAELMASYLREIDVNVIRTLDTVEGTLTTISS